ncbi:MAG TPA: hypothetical protein VGB66_09150, partial [Longimicrobium sp.]|jgi:hypothetical protein
MTRALVTTLALAGLLAGCADASQEPQKPANSEQLPVPPDPSGGTAGMGEGQQDPAVTPASSSQPTGTATPPAGADSTAAPPAP